MKGKASFFGLESWLKTLDGLACPFWRLVFDFVVTKQEFGALAK